MTGTIRYVADFGTVVQFVIDVHEGDSARRVWVCGDGNPSRRALQEAFNGQDPAGRWIAFGMTDWGGLEWFAPTEGGAS